MRPMNFMALEKKYIAQEIESKRRKQAKQSAKEKIRLGFKYGKIDNLESDEQLRELKRREKREEYLNYQKERTIQGTGKVLMKGARKIVDIAGFQTPKRSKKSKGGLFRPEAFTKQYK